MIDAARPTALVRILGTNDAWYRYDVEAKGFGFTSESRLISGLDILCLHFSNGHQQSRLCVTKFGLYHLPSSARRRMENMHHDLKRSIDRRTSLGNTRAWVIWRYIRIPGVGFSEAATLFSSHNLQFAATLILVDIWARPALRRYWLSSVVSATPRYVISPYH